MYHFEFSSSKPKKPGDTCIRVEIKQQNGCISSTDQSSNPWKCPSRGLKTTECLKSKQLNFDLWTLVARLQIRWRCGEDTWRSKDLIFAAWQLSELVQMDDSDGDVIPVPASQLWRQAQHLGQAIWGHAPIAVVAQTVAQKVSGSILILQHRQYFAFPFQKEAL